MGVLLLFLLPALAAAQPAPLVGTTLRTTSTAAGSVRVGCTQGGACTGGVIAGPVDVASVTSGGFIGIANNVPASTVMRLYNDAGTLKWNGITLATGSSLSGTAGKLAKFTAANAVGDSICTEAGSTLTCVNTLAAATGTFTNMSGTLTTASQTNITGVGTLTAGTWNASIIGLAYGGTNADLSATGGTSQFLRQNTVGGTVTVVRPAVADLSDAANVALLNAANVFTAVQSITSSSGAPFIVNSTAANGGAIVVQRSGTSRSFFGSAPALMGAGSSNDTAVYSQSNLYLASEGGALHFLGASATERWGINADGDWTFGPSGNIADSSGTPTCNSGGCTGAGSSIVGSDYAFKITTATANTTAAVITFGRTFANAPICSAHGDMFDLLITPAPTTTTVSFQYPSGSEWNIYVLCRGY
jgi:hypothetical protein